MGKIFSPENQQKDSFSFHFKWKFRVHCCRIYISFSVQISFNIKTSSLNWRIKSLSRHCTENRSHLPVVVFVAARKVLQNSFSLFAWFIRVSFLQFFLVSDSSSSSLNVNHVGDSFLNKHSRSRKTIIRSRVEFKDLFGLMCGALSR